MKILVDIFDALFPPRKTQLLLRSVSEIEITKIYSPTQTHDTVCLSSYKEPLIKALITENKYFTNKAARRYLAVLLEQWLSTHQATLVLVPIPLSAKRERDRGYNQVTVILAAISHHHNVTIDTTLLTRTRHTIAQTTLNREERLTNLSTAFCCDGKKVQSYKQSTIVIIDDVLTTGATMAAAKAALAPHLHPSSKILCLALAH
jgi:ComF family protein